MDAQGGNAAATELHQSGSITFVDFLQGGRSGPLPYGPEGPRPGRLGTTGHNRQGSGAFVSAYS
jgi:hypothetical protein